MTHNTTERTARHRAKRKAEGWTILHCQLPPDASKVLADAVTDKQWTKAEIVAHALRMYAF